jgi:FkbM family methyltransferase
MSYRRTLAQALDRPGGRYLLGLVATQYARRLVKDDVDVCYIDGIWTRRVGDHFLPDSPNFDYAYSDFDNWSKQIDLHVAQSHEYWLRYYAMKAGDVIVDVGAGRGEDAFAFSRAVGKNGRVFAIEAHPVSFAILRNFCRLNRLDNVVPLEFAVASKRGTLALSDEKSAWMENSVVASGANTISVQATTLDEICAQNRINEIALLKMNIEGAECDALLGMEKTFSRVRQVCVACHDFRSENGEGDQFRTRAFVEQFLLDHGFSIKSRPDSPLDFVRDHVFGLRTE